jgi:hypothetical protein
VASGGDQGLSSAAGGRGAPVSAGGKGRSGQVTS